MTPAPRPRSTAAPPSSWRPVLRPPPPPAAAAAADAGVLGNAAAALGALAESGPEGLQRVIVADGVGAIVGACSPQQLGGVQEAAADALCKCVAHSARGKAEAD
jgi:hypothetical protein